VPSPGNPALAPPSPLAVPRATSAQGAVTVAATGATIVEAGLEGHAHDLLAGRVDIRWQVDLDDASPSAAPMPAPTPGATAGEQTRAAMLALTRPPLTFCYQSLTNSNGGAVLALDRVRFIGQDAVFVVSSVPGRPDVVHVWVVDVACGTTGVAVAPKDDKIVTRS
jgi:hypothetical protein